MSGMFYNKDFKSVLTASTLFTLVGGIIILFIDKKAATIFLISSAAITAVYLIYTKKRLNEIEKLNNYLSNVFLGNFDLKIADNIEGELSILENNIFKIVSILKSKNEALEKEKTYLADFMADISHQLKTPLTSMTVMTDLLNESDDPESQKKFAEIIETQLDKMRWLISNLLKVSRLDADAVELKKEMFSIKNALNESLRPFLVTLDLKNIEIINDVEDFEIKGDETWSVEAFGNIIKNCIEHTGKDGKIELHSKRTTVYDSIIIKDTGCGIAKEDIDHIFERFYHGKNSSADSVGIGLALAKTVFEKEMGRISVESEIGKGSTFEIRFYKAII